MTHSHYWFRPTANKFVSGLRVQQAGVTASIEKQIKTDRYSTPKGRSGVKSGRLNIRDAGTRVKAGIASPMRLIKCELTNGWSSFLDISIITHEFGHISRVARIVCMLSSSPISPTADFKNKTSKLECPRICKRFLG